MMAQDVVYETVQATGEAQSFSQFYLPVATVSYSMYRFVQIDRAIVLTHELSVPAPEGPAPHS